MKRKNLLICIILVLVLAMSLMLVACKDSKKDEDKGDEVTTLTEEEEMKLISEGLVEGVVALDNDMNNDKVDYGSGNDPEQAWISLFDRYVSSKINAKVAKTTHYKKMMINIEVNGVFTDVLVKNDGTYVDLIIDNVQANDFLDSTDGLTFAVNDEGKWGCILEEQESGDPEIADNDTRARSEFNLICTVIMDIFTENMGEAMTSEQFANALNTRINGKMEYIKKIDMPSEVAVITYGYTLDSGYSSESVGEIKVSDMSIDNNIKVKVENGVFVVNNDPLPTKTNEEKASEEMELVCDQILLFYKTAYVRGMTNEECVQNINMIIPTLEYVTSLEINGTNVNASTEFVDELDGSMQGMDSMGEMPEIQQYNVAISMTVKNGKFVLKDSTNVA